MRIAFFSGQNVRISKSSRVSFRDLSRTMRRPSASDARSRLFSIPDLSAGLEGLPQPAVSTRWKSVRSAAHFSLIKSRVVPGSGVTMALSSPNKALKSVDFPVLRPPARTSVTPSTRDRPASYVPTSAATSADKTARPSAGDSGFKPKSSSGNSIAASIPARASTRPRRREAMRSDRLPASWREASLAWAMVSALIRSFRASA